ncbi:MAG: FKBP-type peptidyl-prolyl cis-trans isomerase [Desulfocapsaceae bacterium]|nr:FKBP-type peptidyl-prolyl cis-trans isomerase [Desulfocapsaceae bacterium]
MSTITNNSTITIAFIGKLDNGEIFKSVDENSPFTLQLGNQELPPTVENALIGRSAGDIIKVRVSPEEGYGGRQKLLVQKISKKSLGDKIVPKPGMILSLTVSKDGVDHQVPATVMSVAGDMVEIDYNHPLAGHHLNYEVTIIKVE